jgi:hypothetical protein
MLAADDEHEEQHREHQPYLQAEQHRERDERELREVDALLGELGAEDLEARDEYAGHAVHGTVQRRQQALVGRRLGLGHVELSGARS